MNADKRPQNPLANSARDRYGSKQWSIGVRQTESMPCFSHVDIERQNIYLNIIFLYFLFHIFNSSSPTLFVLLEMFFSILFSLASLPYILSLFLLLFFFLLVPIALSLFSCLSLLPIFSLPYIFLSSFFLFLYLSFLYCLSPLFFTLFFSLVLK